MKCSLPDRTDPHISLFTNQMSRFTVCVMCFMDLQSGNDLLKQGLSLQKRLWWHWRPPLSLFFTSLASTNQRFPLQIKLNEMFIRHTHKLQLLGNTIGFYDNKVDIFCEHHNSPEKKNTQNNITDWSSAQFEYIVCESSAIVCVCMYVSVIVIRFWSFEQI